MAKNYLIVGDDGYLKRAEVKKIKNKFLEPGEIDLNYSVHNQDDANDIFSSLRTQPFLAERRVVHAEDAHLFSDDFMKNLLVYLGKPTETSVLILSCPAAFRKNRFFPKFTEFMEIVNAAMPDAKTMVKWIHTFLKKEKVEISSEAARLIVELKGPDPAGVRQELEKLINFSSGEGIELSHVQELVGRSVQDDIFKLVDAIESGSAEGAYRVVEDLYNCKKQPTEIIGYLAWHVRVMQKCAFFLKMSLSPEEAASRLGYSTAFARRLLEKAKNYTATGLRKWKSFLLESDRDIKTGKKTAHLAMEMLLAGLMKVKQQ